MFDDFKKYAMFECITKETGPPCGADEAPTTALSFYCYDDNILEITMIKGGKEDFLSLFLIELNADDPRY